MDIYTVVVEHNGRLMLQDDFKATSKKRAYQLAEDKLWNLLHDDTKNHAQIDVIISECDFQCVDVVKGTK